MRTRMYDQEHLKSVRAGDLGLRFTSLATSPNPQRVLCKCGCGNATNHAGASYVTGHRPKAPDVRKWKIKNRAKEKAQKRRNKIRKQILSPTWLGNCLWRYLKHWVPFTRLQSLIRAWTNITKWTSVLKPKPRSYKRVLNTAWRNVTAWTVCLEWNVSYTPDPELDSKVFVYGLVDPRTLEVRYIGKTVSGLKRTREHYWEKCYNGYKTNWIKQLRDAGLRYNTVVLEICNRDTLSEQEQWWIAYGKLSGWALTNLTDGGDGVIGRVTSPETKAKISAARKQFELQKSSKNFSGVDS